MKCNQFARPVISLASLGLIFGFLLMPATISAQFGGRGFGGQQLTPEQSDSVWTLQAQGVATQLGLNSGATTRLVNTYIQSRTALNEARAEAIGSFQGGGGGAGGGAFGGGGAAGGFGGIQQLTTDATESLQAALGEFLTDQQVVAAITVMGTFSTQWDNYVNVIRGFNLSQEKLDQVLPLIQKYVVDVTAAQAQAMQNQNFQSILSINQNEKSKLDASLSTILTVSQLIAWNTQTQIRTGGGGGFGGGGGGL
ncbi:hypothetical protein ACFLZR_01225 [Candidatus Neomarinimicrobiota bacterium]